MRGFKSKIEKKCFSRLDQKKCQPINIYVRISKNGKTMELDNKFSKKRRNSNSRHLLRSDRTNAINLSKEIHCLTGVEVQKIKKKKRGKSRVKKPVDSSKKLDLQLLNFLGENQDRLTNDDIGALDFSNEDLHMKPRYKENFAERVEVVDSFGPSKRPFSRKRKSQVKKKNRRVLAEIENSNIYYSTKKTSKAKVKVPLNKDKSGSVPENSFLRKLSYFSEEPTKVERSLGAKKRKRRSVSKSKKSVGRSHNFMDKDARFSIKSRVDSQSKKPAYPKPFYSPKNFMKAPDFPKFVPYYPKNYRKSSKNTFSKTQRDYFMKIENNSKINIKEFASKTTIITSPSSMYFSTQKSSSKRPWAPKKKKRCTSSKNYKIPKGADQNKENNSESMNLGDTSYIKKGSKRSKKNSDFFDKYKQGIKDICKRVSDVDNGYLQEKIENLQKELVMGFYNKRKASSCRKKKMIANRPKYDSKGRNHKIEALKNGFLY